MADVRTFRAATMQEALDLVRNELGADAVILHTRQVAKRRLLPWRKPAEEVEITASLTLDVGSSSGRRSAKRSTSTAAVRTGTSIDLPAAPPNRRLGTARVGGNRLDLVSDPPDSIADVLNRIQATPGAHRPAPAELRDPTPSTRPFFEKSAPAFNRIGRNAAFEVGEPIKSDPTVALARRLDTIQKMLHDLGRANPGPRHEDIPAELFQLYAGLIDNEVEDDVARELICQLKQSATPRQLSDASGAKNLLTAMVESEIRCCEPITPRPAGEKSSHWLAPRASARQPRSPSLPPTSGCEAESRWDSSPWTRTVSRRSSSCGLTRKSSSFR